MTPRFHQIVAVKVKGLLSRNKSRVEIEVTDVENQLPTQVKLVKEEQNQQQRDNSMWSERMQEIRAKKRL